MDFEPWTFVRAGGPQGFSSRAHQSRGNRLGSIFLLVQTRVDHISDPRSVCSLELISSDSSSTNELFCIDALKAVNSTLLGDDSRILASCSASSLSSLAVVSATLGMRDWAVGFVLSFCIVRNDWNNSFWNFVLIQKELDKGLSVG